MNEIINKFLLVEDRFMLEIHLRQPLFTYSCFEPFTKNKEKIKKLNKQEICDVFIQANELKLVFNV